MLLGFILGVLATLTVQLCILHIFPRLVTALQRTIWKMKDDRVFLWAIWDTYLRQTNLRGGGRLGNVTRQTRRRITREVVRRMV